MEKPKTQVPQTFFQRNRNLIVIVSIILVILPFSVNAIVNRLILIFNPSPPDIIYMDEYHQSIYIQDIDRQGASPQLLYETSSFYGLENFDYDSGPGYYLSRKVSGFDQYGSILLSYPETHRTVALFDCATTSVRCRDYFANPERRAFIYIQELEDFTTELWYAAFEEDFTQHKIATSVEPVAWIDANRFTYVDFDLDATIIYNTLDDNKEIVAGYTDDFLVSPDGRYYAQITREAREDYVFLVGEFGKATPLATDSHEFEDPVYFVEWLSDNSGFVYYQNVAYASVPIRNCATICSARLMFFDMETLAATELHQSDGSIWQVDVHSGDNRILFTVSHQGRGYQAFIYDFVSDAVQVLPNVTETALWLH